MVCIEILFSFRSAHFRLESVAFVTQNIFYSFVYRWMLKIRNNTKSEERMFLLLLLSFQLNSYSYWLIWSIGCDWPWTQENENGKK